jgi:hypothetical protein
MTTLIKRRLKKRKVLKGRILVTMMILQSKLSLLKTPLPNCKMKQLRHNFSPKQWVNRWKIRKKSHKRQKNLKKIQLLRRNEIVEAFRYLKIHGYII